MTTISMSEILGRPVFDVATATTVGQVSHGVVDPGNGQLAALTLKKTAGPETLLPWSDIKAIGPDAITIDTGDVLRAPEGQTQDRAVKGGLDPLGKRVLTDAGEAIGHLTDLSIEEDGGRISELIVDQRRFEGSVIVGSGSYAVIIDRGASAI